MKRTMYANQAARIVYRSYAPAPVLNLPHKPWQFALVEAMALLVLTWEVFL